MWLYILLGGLLVVILLLMFFSSGPIRKVLSDEHFFEIAQRLPALKQVALERVEEENSDPIQSADDPRNMLTETGLLIVYTVARHEGDYVHHWSISFAARGYTAHAVGDTFTHFVAHQLGLDIDRFALGISPRTVHHAQLVMPPAEYDEYLRRKVADLNPEDLRDFRRLWADTYRERETRWERLSM